MSPLASPAGPAPEFPELTRWARSPGRRTHAGERAPSRRRTFAKVPCGNTSCAGLSGARDVDRLFWPVRSPFAVHSRGSHCMDPELVTAYRRYFPLLVRKCARMLRDPQEAQDVAQESFVRLCEAQVLHADPRVVTAWLYRTSTRLAIDRIRSRSRVAAAQLEDLALATEASSPEARAHAHTIFQRVMRSLPREELEAALLSRLDGLTQPEIAEVMGIHERSVRRLLSQLEARIERLRSRSEV
jgi:RNA polymerase sigma-70 factor, ECF subfamily